MTSCGGYPVERSDGISSMLELAASKVQASANLSKFNSGAG
jgi:hypothetical protein